MKPMKISLLIAGIILGLPAMAQAQTGNMAANSHSTALSASGAYTGPSSSGVSITSTTTNSGNIPSDQTIHQNVQAPDVVTSGANLCALPVGGSVAFLGGGGGLAFSAKDQGCEDRSDAAAWYAMGDKNMAIAMMCATPEDQKQAALMAVDPCSPATLQAAQTVSLKPPAPPETHQVCRQVFVPPADPNGAGAMKEECFQVE